MVKIFFIVAILVLSFSNANAAPNRCVCRDTVEDYLGHVSDISVYVQCPNAQKLNELRCTGDITNNYFTASCMNRLTEEEYVTTIELDPMTKPDQYYPVCQLSY